ncbi:MAG: 2,5-diamino-6-(ribosylamino)-4(3H)-pyrimidinone 5'-phosphate reductase [Bathelium mastoideum]|nr:MAG: 2,5-diamino-6-(ribosylamino)-4(3H)-pyrimidinone 5'-phosphate reductase [Bathelium mastoideum]
MAEPPMIRIPTEHAALTRSNLVIPPLSMPIPPGTSIDDLRVRLYTLTTPIRFTGADFAKYWPYVTNLWTRQYRGHLDQHGVQLELWHCKNSHTAIRPPAVREHRGEGIRNRPFREIPNNCGMKMRIAYYYGGRRNEQDLAEWVLLSNDYKGSGVHQHHTLDDLDRARRCKRFQDICYRKTTEGYSAPAITRWFRRAYAGQDWCKYIGRMDVKNAGQLWRAKHREVEMKTEVEHDQPMPEDEEDGPNWLEKAIDEAPYQQLKDVLKSMCNEVPATQQKVIPKLMKWEPQERSPTPPEEVQGGIFQTPDGNLRVVQPRARRDLVQRTPSMVFVEAPQPRMPQGFSPSQQQMYPVDGPTVYPPQQPEMDGVRYTGPSSVPVEHTPVAVPTQPSSRIPAAPTAHQSPPNIPQALPQIPQAVGGGMPGRPPNQPKSFSVEPRPIQPAPRKRPEDPFRSVIHVDSVSPAAVPVQETPATNLAGTYSQAPLFTARPRWAK